MFQVEDDVLLGKFKLIEEYFPKAISMKKTNPIKFILINILYYSGIAFLIERLISKRGFFLILGYHMISNNIKSDNARYCITTELFEEQIKFIKKNYNIIKLSEIDPAGKSEVKNIVITFDDGFEDNYKNAFSVIKKYNIPVYIFLISNYISQPYFLNWDQILEMKKSGLVFFGNHTRDHISLNTSSYESTKSHVLEANNELREKLENVEYFSYPYGDFNNMTIKILMEAGFKYGITCIEGVNTPETNPYLLKRIFINDLDIQTKFILKYPNLAFNIKSFIKKLVVSNTWLTFSSD